MSSQTRIKNEYHRNGTDCQGDLRGREAKTDFSYQQVFQLLLKARLNGRDRVNPNFQHRVRQR
jgi:hypothetical protein